MLTTERTAVRAGLATLAVIAAAVAGLVLTGSERSPARARPAADGLLVGQASDRLPADTARDWVGYADHVVAVRAEAERALPADPEETARGEGYLGRAVRLRVARTLWTRPGAPALPAAVEADMPGWVSPAAPTPTRARPASRSATTT
ncbi:hypothetical protein [Actinomadura kijaniata]|uniref:hypothetical protein n=1 Tax=Actinomadura kijaniata TaxID=46161 RepID=UPI000832EBA2|nr:hypothetical protein [Actinomadura kijaniata]